MPRERGGGGGGGGAVCYVGMLTTVTSAAGVADRQSFLPGVQHQHDPAVRQRQLFQAGQTATAAGQGNVCRSIVVTGMIE